jgi:hypothetical protein
MKRPQTINGSRRNAGNSLIDGPRGSALLVRGSVKGVRGRCEVAAVEVYDFCIDPRAEESYCNTCPDLSIAEATRGDKTVRSTDVSKTVGAA